MSSVQCFTHILLFILIYAIRSLHVAIDGTTGNTLAFARRLDEAAQMMKGIVQKA